MLDDKSSEESRNRTYLDGLTNTLADRRAVCDKKRRDYITPEKCAENREEYRRDYINMLGWPLNEYEELKSSSMQVKKTYRGDVGYADMWQIEFEVLPHLWFDGLFFESKDKEGSLPFIIAQHGAAGSPEVAAELYGGNNYNGMIRRAATYSTGANVFAPRLYIWESDEARQALDIRLKQVGGSLTSLEIFAVRRVLDYFVESGVAKEGHIAMMGLSYGGFYSLMTAAADTRICAAYSSCQFNNRYEYGREDWIWDGSAKHFLDAEIAALVAPRALFLDESTDDEFFSAEAFISECERAGMFFSSCDAGDKFKYQTFSGTHEFCPNDNGIKFIYENV